MGRMSHEVRSLEMLSHKDCLALLGLAHIGRAVFTVAALPAIVPVTFGVHDDAVVLCTSADSRLAVAANGSVLAFQVDELDPVSRTGWSVVVTGVAELVTDPAERVRLSGLVAPWAPGQRDVFIRLPFTVVTGRRIGVAPSPESAAV
jgi:nitroimidazol reductase NimA-like FMN-containing flavoprotein (pyridoxamine 5'-phosphate oxidase superfamily)